MFDISNVFFSKIQDNRSSKKSIALFSPAGDKKMLELFVSIIKKQSFKDFDVLLIYPKGAEFFNDDSLSIINAEEKLPLGTSGCFFAGQVFLYQQGYDIIINVDLDAIPSTPDLLSNLISKAIEKKIVCVPLSASEEKIIPGRFIINHYGAFPRSVFDNIGFVTPYFWRGAEDWDMAQRLQKHNLIEVVNSLHILHPLPASSVYHKLVSRKKYYPYLSSLMKAFLLQGGVKNIFKYICWYSFYAFFSNVFSDQELRDSINYSSSFKLLDKISEKPFLVIESSGSKSGFEQGYIGRLISNVKVFAGLVASGKGSLGSDTFSLPSGARTGFILRSLFSIIICPLYPLESLVHIAIWQSQKDKIIYPVKPSNLEESVSIYLNYLRNKSL